MTRGRRSGSAGAAAAWRLLAAVALAMLAIPFRQPVPAAAAAERQSGSFLDLAWIVPAPSEVPEPGYGIVSGGRYALAAESGVTSAGTGAHERFETALKGFEQGYFGRLARPREEDPDFYARTVNTQVTQFRDREAARAGWDLQLAHVAQWGGSRMAIDPGLGVEAVMFRLSGSGGDGAPYQAVGVTALTPPLVVTVQVLDFEGDHPPASLAAQIARPVVERAAAAQMRTGPGPGRMYPRFGGVHREEYRRRDGEELPVYLALEADVAASGRANERMGAADAFTWSSTVRSPGKPDVSWNGWLWRMGSDQQARDLVQRYYASWLEAPPEGVSDVIPIPPERGDDPRRIVAFTWRTSRGDVAERGYRVWYVRGGWAGSLAAHADPGIGWKAFDAASSLAVSCLSAPWCPEDIWPPPVLAAGSEEEAALPAAAAPAPASAGRADLPAPLLDLAWIAPRSSDLAGAGFGRISRAGWTTPEAFEWMTLGKPQAAALFGATMAMCGWRQGWSGSLAAPLPDDPDYFARRLHTELVQTETAAGAAELAAAFAQFALPASGMEAADPLPGGDPDTLFFRDRGVLRDGTMFNVAAELVRDGDVVLLVTLADFTGDAPSFSELAALAAPARERLARARDGEGSGLALRIPRYAWPGMSEQGLDYLLVDGEAQPWYAATEADMEVLREQLAGLGVGEAVLSWMDLPANARVDVELGLWHTLSVFPDAAAADAYIDKEVEQVQSEDPLGRLDLEITEGLEAGDRAVLATYLASGGPRQPAWQAADIWVRVGPMVNRVGVTAPAALPRADLERLAARAAECLRTAACGEFGELPPSLLADPDPVARPPGGRLQPTA